ncbi:Transposase IS3/IS911 family protein, partial [human gut metagenome]
KKTKELSKDLRLKEKALAETTALLVLRKKLNAIFGEDIFLVVFFTLLAHPPVAFDFQVASVDLLIPVSIDKFVGEMLSGGSILAIIFSFSSLVNFL